MALLDLIQLHNPPLRLPTRLNVALGSREVRVTSEQLDVPQRPADGRDLSSGVGDEGPSTAMAGTSREAEVGILPGVKVHDCLGGGPGSPLRRDREGGRAIMNPGATRRMS